MNITNHAMVRCGQRGFRITDIDLIVRFGTMTDEGVLLTKKDIMEAERQVKDVLKRLSKLEGTFVSTTPDGETVKTIFRTTKRQRRKQTRRW